MQSTYSIEVVAKTLNKNANSTEINQASIYAATTSRFKFGSSSSLLNPITLSHRFREAIINDDLNLAKRIYERAIQSSNPFPTQVQLQDGDGENGIARALLSNPPHLYSPPRRQSDISTNSTLNGNLNQTSKNNQHTFNFVPSLNLKENTRLTASQRAFIAQSKINSSNSNSNFIFDVRNVSNNIHHQTSTSSGSGHNRDSNSSILTGIGPTSSSIGNGREMVNHHHSGKGKKKEESLQSKSETTPSLILAVEKDASIDLIEWLLDQGHERLGEPSRDLEENTIIAVAAYKGRTDVIELYCQNPNLDVPSLLDHSDSNGKTALHLAALKGNADVVRLLVDLGADIDLPDREGNTALHYASSWGHLTVVQTLIERGCGFAIKNSKGFTASDFSFTHGVQAAVEAFGREQFEVMTNARKLEARKKAREFRNRENYSSNNSGGGGGENGLGLISNINGNSNGTPGKDQGIGTGNEETGIENLINSEKGVEMNLKDKDINSVQSNLISSSNNNSSKSPKSLRHHPSLPQLPFNKSNNHYLNSFPKISSSDSLFDGSIVHSSNKEINSSTNNNTSGISQSGSTSTIASNSDLSLVANRMRMKDQMAMGEYLSKTLNTPSNSNGGLGSAIHSISSTPIKSKSPGIVQSGTTTPPPIPNSNEKSKFISSPLNQTSSTSRSQGSTTEGNQSTPNSPSNHQRSQSEGALNASYENQSLINQSPSKMLKWKKSDLTNTPPPLPSK